ncbi:N-methylhydantoinase B [Thermosporothrix hazakensis]|jgi:N-methylhydantoinase B|uniref:N-methylhydantoinase B n=2 Tax=Thermosporothrix TaxID=768650 RepID=A0A326UJ42_THEHA|nr:hydantoinase B/oxoprolinase family protein [Thermosporothrix hazakensis]PZW32128.1 N-methylhydantoinase B [Thermosporothrix hazakensis]BBH91398.1 N-methylhydantoinase B [Thermosporothrix sp. COM3]GCE49544.1 N-methylhydantoinase B [Thermosporothrix hazakensis]
MGKTPNVTPVSLEIFRSALTAIAEEMGTVLTLSSYSPNIKERRDFSCALFDIRGRLIAQGDHMPVHLGAMPDSVASALAAFTEFAPGDVVILNDPYLGGSHLPDITLIAPIYVEVEGKQRLIGFAANRAHHSDVGGISPGSMPLATEVYQEGVIIPPSKLWDAGRLNQPLLSLILRNIRTPDERRGDLAAQIAANRTAGRRLQELVERWGIQVLEAHIDALIAYAQRITEAAIEAIPDGTYYFVDYLDDDGVTDEPVMIRVAVTVQGKHITVDFSGSSPQTRGNVNTVAAVTRSAVYYVVRCLMPSDAPTNAGTFAPVTVLAPEGTVVHARPPAAVAQGNVETSQRITDVVLGALAQVLPATIPAAGQGTMNNITAGGFDPRTQQPFAYYETMGGGMGASLGQSGLSGVHVHMSNTLNTPVEAFEYAYPMRIMRYQLREGSGGVGAACGGDGLVREIQFEVPTEVTLLSDRRRFAPYGLQGGEPGAKGENRLLSEGKETVLPGKVHLRVQPGDRLIIATPGGGGWGSPSPVEPGK